MTYRISLWASKNLLRSRILLILTEVFRLGIGIWLGSTWMKLDTIDIWVTLLVLVIPLLQNIFSDVQSRKFMLRGNALLFTCSFALSFLLGSQFKSKEVFKQVHATEVKTNLDSVRVASLESLKTVEKTTGQEDKREDKQVRWFSAFLFLLAMILTYLGVVLACSLSCSGYGLAAALVFLLSTGVFSSGLYFLIKLFSKGKLRYPRNNTKEHKRKERKRFFKIWGVLVGLIALFYLVIFIVNS